MSCCRRLVEEGVLRRRRPECLFFYFLLSLVAGLLDGQEVEVCVFFFFSIKLLLGVYVAVSLWEENVFRSLTWLQEVTNRTPRPNLQVAIQHLVCGSLSY